MYAKGKYIVANGYGGATMWTVDLDDFQNRCCLESYPLLKTINRALGMYRSYNDRSRAYATVSIIST